MKLQEKKDDATLVLAVLGRIDSETAEAFGTALHASIATPGIEKVVLDFREVGFISSACLRVLMLGLKQARENKVMLVMAAMQPMLLEIFQLSRIDTLISCVSTIEQAMKKTIAPAGTPLQAKPIDNGISVRFWGTRGS